MSTVYIVFARFDLLSLERQEKYVRPVAESIKSFTEQLNAEIAELYFEAKTVLPDLFLSPHLRVFCFAWAVIIIIPGSAMTLFFSVLRKVFFNLLMCHME